jgi:chromosome segregation ATPase
MSKVDGRTSEASDEWGMGLHDCSRLSDFINSNNLIKEGSDMAEVQSQSASNPEPKVQNREADKDALINRLDELLEKYLHTLDEYQKTREQLSKQLSSVRRDYDSVELGCGC